MAYHGLVQEEGLPIRPYIKKEYIKTLNLKTEGLNGG